MRNVLLISKIPPSNATTIEDHVNALVEFSTFKVKNVDISDPNVYIEISNADCILLHYSVIAYPYRDDNIVNSFLRLHIVNANKPVLHMVQDEQRNALERIRYFQTLGVCHVFSVADPEVIELLYPVNLRSFTTSTLLTGYVPVNLQAFRNTKWEERPIDISYRARRLPSWYGHLGFTKSQISDQLNKVKKDLSLTIDASCEENDRLYGQNWIDFLCNSKVAVGTESGSSRIDMDGRFQESWQIQYDSSAFGIVEPVQANYAAISPRIFEYAAANCLLALTPGKYSGILSPGLHYFELQSDMSNFNELLELMEDKVERERMILRAYEELISSSKYSYQQMAKEVDFWINVYISNLNGHNVIREDSSNIIQEDGSNKESRVYWKRRDLPSRLLDIFRMTKGKIYHWSHSRKGIFRDLLRRLYRMFKSIVSSHYIRCLRILFSSKSDLKSDFIKSMQITKSIFRSLEILPELLLVKEEALNLSFHGYLISVEKSPNSVWLSWPDRLEPQSQLKAHPYLNALHFSDFEGVWLTRSDYSTTSKPTELRFLSKLYKTERVKTLRLIEMFTAY